MTIEEIQSAMQAVVDAAEAETRSLTTDEIERYEGLEKDLLTAQKSADVQKRAKAFAAPNVVTRPITGAAKGDEVLTRAFEHYLRTGQENMDIAELRAQGTGSGSVGGYTIPDEPMKNLVEVRAAFGGIRSVAQVLTTATGAPLPWPTVDDTANTGEIVAEGSTIASGDDIVFGTVNLGAYTYMSGGASNLPLRVPKALAQDAAFDIGALVTRLLGRRIARAQAADFAQGDGSGEPLGLFHIEAEVQTASGGALTLAALNSLLHAVDPEYRDGASWVMSDATLALIENITDGSDRPLLLPNAISGLEGSPSRGMLLGHPVIVDQSSPAWSATATDDVAGSPVAGEGYIAFGNIEEAFVIRDVAGVEVMADPFGRMGYGEIQYFATARADATIQNASAFALLQGYSA